MIPLFIFIILLSESVIRTVCLDPCSDNLPCLNGGQCDSLPNGKYICTCKNDYLHYGKNCETNINNDVISIYEPSLTTVNQTTYWNTTLNDEGFNLMNGSFTFGFKTSYKNAMLLFLYDQYLNYIQIQLINGITLRVMYSMTNSPSIPIVNEEAECHDSGDGLPIWRSVYISMSEVICTPGKSAKLIPKRTFRNTIIPLFIYTNLRVPNMGYFDKQKLYKEGLNYSHLYTYLYLGGTPDMEKSRVEPSQFRGCFRGFRFDNKTVSLRTIGKQKFGQGLSTQCEAGCKKFDKWTSCYFKGTCDERWNGQFSCDCFSSPYIGPQCSTDKYFDFDGKSVLKYELGKGLPLSISRMKMLIRLQKLKVDDYNIILYHVIGTNKMELTIYLLQSMLLKYVYRSPTVNSGKPVIGSLSRRLTQEHIVMISVTFESGETQTKFTIVEVRILDKSGNVGGVTRLTTSTFTTNRKPETFYIKRMFIGGTAERTEVNSLPNRNYTGCLNNLAVEFISFKRQKQIVDFSTHWEFQFLSDSNGIKRSSECNINVVPPTVPPPPTTTTKSLVEPSKEPLLPQWSNPSDPEEVVVVPINEPSNNKSDSSLGLLIGGIMALIVVALVVLLVIYFRFIRSKPMSKSKSKDTSVRMWPIGALLPERSFDASPSYHQAPSFYHFSHDDCSTLPLRTGSPICSTYATSNGSVKHHDDFAPSESFTLPYRPAYKAMTVVAQEEGFFARGEDDIDSSDVQDNNKMTNRRACPGRVSSANSSGNPESPLFFDTPTPSPPDLQTSPSAPSRPCYSSLPAEPVINTISHNRVRLPQWRNHHNYYTLHQKRTSPRSSIQSSYKDTDSDSGLGVPSANGKHSVTFKL